MDGCSKGAWPLWSIERRSGQRARRWEDFLAIGVTEIRVYGSASVQVSRRVRAMLIALLAAVLTEHRPPPFPAGVEEA